jgi:hypothetical protein
MRLSEERLEDIATAIVERLLDEELIDVTGDERKLAVRVARVLQQDLAKENQIQLEAIDWLRQNKRHMLEGTSEWEIALERKRHDLAVAKGYVLP